MALYRDQNDYDSDHNGRLSGSEWLSWYYDTYGNDIQAAERRQNSAFRAQWDTWLNRTAAYVKTELDSAVKNTAILLRRGEKKRRSNVPLLAERGHDRQRKMA